MPAPFGGWSPLWRDDAAQREMQQDNSGAEFTTPPGYREPDQYRGTAASDSRPYALPE